MGRFKQSLEEMVIERVDKLAVQRTGDVFEALPSVVQFKLWCEAENEILAHNNLVLGERRLVCPK
ncbi:MAG: hypothetical protein PHC43_00320 [Candidatus Marinimicrobia bacterium]|jgi:hypothetical protein|nr:hypothetical protein [Candidatus Neomarinimicrobiota bacterium]